MKQNQVYDYILLHLREEYDLETLVLKGHLILEQALNGWLGVFINSEKRLQNLNLSFAKKVDLVVALYGQPNARIDKLVGQLKEINRIRNKLAHHLEFDVHREDLIAWCKSVSELEYGIDKEITLKRNVISSYSGLSSFMVGLVAGIRHDRYLTSQGSKGASRRDALPRAPA